MKKQTFPFYCYWLIGIVACNSQKAETNFERDLPDYKNGKSLKLMGLQASRDALKLDTLENGFDSLQIRVWFTYARIDTFQILSLKKRNHTWSGSYCKTGFRTDENTDSVLSYSKEEHDISPNLSWQLLFDSLCKFNILTLPDCTKIKDYNFPFDGGNSVNFEISTKEKYRLFVYQLPSQNKKFEAAANADNILKLLSEAFNIRYLSKY